MNAQSSVLALFNCLVVAPHQKRNTPFVELIGQGVVTNFNPSAEQRDIFRSVLKPLDMRTLFSREERENAPLADLLTKQFLHYIEVYGLGMPGLFDLEVDNGSIVSLRYVHGITVAELEEMVCDLLDANAPVKDAKQLQNIIEHYGLTFNINGVVNNELRVLLWSERQGSFTSGDDAVRYMCAKATGDALLIKSKEVLAAVKAHKFPASFFEQHEDVLAQVFNRHKRIILSAKNKATAAAINRITRLSKTKHVPVRESIAKTFIHKALMGEADASALEKVSVRDKFKYLNLLATKRLGNGNVVFKIRNGKVYYRNDMQVYPLDVISRVESMVIDSLAKDLEHLKDTTILLDENVDYGLPTSRKQTLGQLPFGTKVTSTANEISSGIYWENGWGAHDLDLSGINLDGERVGWGSYRGYNDSGIVFSGDVVDAHNGAMEFLTSRTTEYGIVVNIFNGREGSEMELVVGRNTGRTRWLSETLVRERHKLESRNCLLGFVKGKTFVVYTGRMDNRRVSDTNPTLQAMKTNFWTVHRLLTTLGINFDVEPQDGFKYTHDLSYNSFSFDKLEALFK